MSERKKFLYLPTAVNNAEPGEAPLDQPVAEEIWPPIGAPRYPCPCCGYYTFPVPKEKAIAYGCPVCFWENDVFDPGEDAPSDENRGMTLREGRANYKKYGAVREDLVIHARKPLREELPENQ